MHGGKGELAGRPDKPLISLRLCKIRNRFLGSASVSVSVSLLGFAACLRFCRVIKIFIYLFRFTFFFVVFFLFLFCISVTNDARERGTVAGKGETGRDNTAAVSQGKTNCQDQRPDGQSMCPDNRHNTGT